MDKYAELIHGMADTYLTLARKQQKENELLRQENELLRTIVKELREANDIYWEEHRHE